MVCCITGHWILPIHLCLLSIWEWIECDLWALNAIVGMGMLPTIAWYGCVRLLLKRIQACLWMGHDNLITIHLCKTIREYFLCNVSLFHLLSNCYNRYALWHSWGDCFHLTDSEMDHNVGLREVIFALQRTSHYLSHSDLAVRCWTFIHIIELIHEKPSTERAMIHKG